MSSFGSFGVSRWIIVFGWVLWLLGWVSGLRLGAAFVWYQVLSVLFLFEACGVLWLFGAAFEDVEAGLWGVEGEVLLRC